MARNSKSSKGSTKQPETEETPATDATEVSEADALKGSEQTDSVESDETGTSETEDTSVTDEAAAVTDTNEESAEVQQADQTDEVVVTETEEPQVKHEPVPGVIEAQSETSTPSLSSPPPPSSSGPGVLAMMFGGLVAGGIGFLIATYAIPEGSNSALPDASGEEYGGVETALAEQSERLDALSSDLAALRDAPPVVTESGETVDLGPLTEQVAAIDTAVTDVRSELDERLSALEDRMTALEEQPATLSPDGSAAMEAQLEEFRQQLDDVTADAEARIAAAQEEANRVESEAAEAAAAARRDSALASLRASLDDGTAYADALAEFENVPEPLASQAESGVPTLSSLQAEFPDAARDALAASTSVSDTASMGERVTSFLRRQTNARSLAPRDGDDPDAILSRAEARVSAGDLDAALEELSALPDAARDAMSDWISAAETRASALQSIESLETATN